MTARALRNVKLASRCFEDFGFEAECDGRENGFGDPVTSA
jgi:hypothetical protein